MLKKIAKLDKLVDAEGSLDHIKHCDSVKCQDFTLSSVTTGSGTVLLIAQSKDLPSKLVCKINLLRDDIAFTRLSPDLTRVACFTSNSEISVISTQNFLDFVAPRDIVDLVRTPIFPQTDLGFSLQDRRKPSAQIYTSSSSRPPIIDAFWWTVGEKKFIVLITRSGVDVISPHSFTVLHNVLATDICSAAYSVKNGSEKVLIALFTRTNTHILTLTMQGGEINHNMTLEGKVFNSQQPIIGQFSLVDEENRWFLSVLNERLVFFDEQMMNIPITSFDGSSSKTNCYAITKNFIFHSTNGECRYQFIKSIDVGNLLLMKDVVSIGVVDAEHDIVVITSKSKVTIFSLTQEPEVLFSNFLRKHHYREAFALCDGFSLDTKSLCEQAATKCIKSHDYDSALEVLHEGKCEIRPSLQRLISEGMDRHALHLLIRSGLQLPPAKMNKIYDLLLRKIILKQGEFTRMVTAFKKCLKGDKVFLPTLKSAHSLGIIDKLKKGEDVNIPDALSFMFQLKSRIESTKYVDSASSIDINSKMPLTFSSQFVVLLHTIDKMEKCEELKLPICSKLRFLKDKRSVYIEDGHICIQKMMYTTKNPIINFEIFGSNIYIIDSFFNVFVSSTKNIDFSEADVPNSILMESSTSKIVFVTVSGCLAIINNHNAIEYVEGNFVDVALYNGVIYALDNNGIVYSITERGKSIAFDSHFVTSICSSYDNGLVFACDNLVFYKFGNEVKTTKLDFNVKFAKSSQENAILVGDGQFALIGKDKIDIIKFSQRTGSVLDVVCDDNESVIIVGSSSPPMRVFFDQTHEERPLLYEDSILIARSYPHDLVIPLVKGKTRALLLVLYGFPEEIKNENESDIMSIIPYFSQMNEDNALNAIHSIVSSGCTLSTELLENELVPKAFLRYPEDLKRLSTKQLMSLYQRKNTSSVSNRITHEIDYKEVGYKIFNLETRSTFIMPSQINQNNLYAFSCVHVLNQEELQNGLNMLKDFCDKSKLPETYKQIENDYKAKNISCPCPRCLIRQLSTKY